MIRILMIAAFISTLMLSTAFGSTISWTDWTSATTGSSGSASGVISVGGSNVNVSFTGALAFAQLGTGTNYWTEGSPAPYTGNAVIDNAPIPAEMLALNLTNSYTLTFSKALVNPVFAIVSLGQPGLAVTYDFNTPFTVLSEGRGYWGDGSYTLGADDKLTGNELHAALQFNGTVSSISWTSTPNENWHGITIGAVSVPEPSAMLLLGSGLAVLAFYRRSRKQV